MNPIKKHQKECRDRVKAQPSNKALVKSAKAFVSESIRSRYFYNFSWLGRPVIQFPQDLMALQEIIWTVKPDLIIETGIAHGGSLIFSASMLEMLGGKRDVLGIDIDIRAHNLKEIKRHPMYKRITMIEGSSVDEGVAEKVRKFAKGRKSVLVVLDSNHVRDHVLQEIELYSPLVTRGSYCVVMDSYIENFTAEFNKEFSYNRWNGDNPKTAVDLFLKKNSSFVIDQAIEDKLLITAAAGGYLKRVR
jgi:cephalosporin hydroxylase